MSYIQSIKESTLKPIYSPRTSYSKYCDEIQKLTTHLTINIDKYMLGFLKQQFDQTKNSLSLNQFIAIARKHLGNWQKDLPDRENKIIKCLTTLYEEIDQKKINKITWEQFNSLLIQKVLNLKSLRNQNEEGSILVKSPSWEFNMMKLQSPVQKIVWIKDSKRLAFFCEQSNKIDFFSTETGISQNIKPLILNKQQLMVETTINKRKKQGGKEHYKKQVMVANYKNIFLDMIYLGDPKYKMLLTSSSDRVIRGWDMSSNILSVARQPQNEDQKMQHQFPAQIHCMAWDSVNEVLYCSGKSPRIYEWLVKTDSQTQLWDENGHQQMISSMIMMPKLQFLATGGYDGKLILWDTIGQKKKFKYQQHTRSIVDMTFHEGLILLFTAAYDHSICVWNPYIPSLIHKITNNINVIQLGIIPDTNLLLALDVSGVAKIRQVNKFSLISKFSIEIQQGFKNQATIMTASEDPIKYYFGGQFMSCFQYIKMDSTNNLDFTPLCLKYIPSKFKLLIPIKSFILIWDFLTGKLHDTLKNQSQSEISAYDISQELHLAVIGDFEGQLTLRKMDNGLLFKKLHQFKSAVSHLIIRNGGIWCDKVIISVSQQGQIIVFSKQTAGQFVKTRNISIKSHSNSIITCIQYQQKRNVLIVGTSSSEIIFVDVDKNKVISKSQSNSGQIQRIIQIQSIPLLLAFSKKSYIFGIYLPPHSKKFKLSCNITTDSLSKIVSASYSTKYSKVIIGYENGDIQCSYLFDDALQEANENEVKKIKFIWKVNLGLGQPIKDLKLIQSNNIIIALSGQKGIFLLSMQNGHTVSKIKPNSKQQQPQIIFYMNEDTNQLYDPISKKSNKIVNIGQQLRKYHDPFYYIDQAQSIKFKFAERSNPSWNFHPDLRQQAEQNISKIKKTIEEVFEYEKKSKKKHIGSIDIKKAIELQRRWQKQKQQQQDNKMVSSNMGKSGTFVINSLKRQQIIKNLPIYKSKKKQQQ